MTRFADVATLISITSSVSECGSIEETTERTDVFVNRYTLGAAAWAAARSNGLHSDSTVEMRSCDYNGEQVVEYQGETYDVERVSNKGEFTTLTLAKRLSHG